MPEGTVLAVHARGLAKHIEAFNDLVAQDTVTHDGQPRGEDWHEGPREVSGRDLKRWSQSLDDLADLWDFG